MIQFLSEPQTEKPHLCIFAHLCQACEMKIVGKWQKSTQQKFPIRKCIGKLKLTRNGFGRQKTINLRHIWCWERLARALGSKGKKLINAKSSDWAVAATRLEKEVKKPQKEFFAVKQITWTFHNRAQNEIIKNPFDIVQLTLQLFAPLTELMELAEIPLAFSYSFNFNGTEIVAGVQLSSAKESVSVLGGIFETKFL